MTLKELIETNHRLGELHVDVRDCNTRALLNVYHIGSHARPDTEYERLGRKEPRWETINVQLNQLEIDHHYWGVRTKVVPKGLLDLEVDYWDIYATAFTMNNGLWELKELTVTLKGHDYAIPTTAVEETPQLEGQMCIEDYLD